ncbi:MAG: septum formation protein Maf [Clostridia bacterium]|nr:septum formation protein Maf [Clostridia bacterium]
MQNETILYLASASPRRREILEKAGYQPVIVPADADESSVRFVPGDPCGYVKALAKLKNDAARLQLSGCTEGIVLTADTVVVSDDSTPPLGKPRDRTEAVRMLSSLSGRTHRVITGVMLCDLADPANISLFSVSTEVRFRSLPEDEIAAYCDSPEPYDKAGGYGIQGAACIFVDSLCGDYYNVVGLPVCRVHEEILRMTAGKSSPDRK